MDAITYDNRDIQEIVDQFEKEGAYNRSLSELTINIVRYKHQSLPQAPDMGVREDIKKVYALIEGVDSRFPNFVDEVRLVAYSAILSPLITPLVSKLLSQGQDLLEQFAGTPVSGKVAMSLSTFSIVMLFRLTKETYDPDDKKEQPDDVFQSYRTFLNDNMRKHFNKVELEDVCFNLGIDYENFAPQIPLVISREIILYMERHGRLEELIALLQQKRNFVEWKKYESY